MRRIFGVLAGALFAGFIAACSDEATAPTGPTVEANVLTGVDSIPYAATCTMAYEEVEHPALADVFGERVIGKGRCVVEPLKLFGRAKIVMEAWETYPQNGGYLIEGQLFYTFENGSRLVSSVRMLGSEVKAAGSMPFDFGQKFLRGTNKLAGVNGGQGYGEGWMLLEAGEAKYHAKGVVTIGPRPE